MQLSIIATGLEKIFASMHLSPRTIVVYQRRWKKIGNFLMENFGDEDYDIDKGMVYFQKEFGIAAGQPLEGLTIKQVAVLRVINILEDFRLHGALTRLRYNTKNPVILAGSLKNALESYNEDLTKNEYSQATIEACRLVAQYFLIFLQQLNVLEIATLEKVHCDAFIKTWARLSAYSLRYYFYGLKRFLGFLKSKNLTAEDLSEKLPSLRLPRRSLIPSYWTLDEVKKLLNSIDRNHPTGKRDYAMILLAAVLGIRAGDISRLKLNNFDLKANKVSFVQHKTGNPLELPLPKQIKDAVEDYIENGRPQYFDTELVFLKHTPPFESLQGQALTAMLQRRRKAAGIPKADRHRGFHSLRHTAASMYLEMETPLPVISELLGHTSVKTTGIYLKGDLKKLMECVLEPVEIEDDEE